MTVLVRLRDGNRIAFAQNNFSVHQDNKLEIVGDDGRSKGAVHPDQWTAVEVDLSEPEAAE